MPSLRVLPLLLFATCIAWVQGLSAQSKATDAPKALRRIQMPVVPGWYSLGSADAPLTLVEFTDYECPLCHAFHTETFARLKQKYIDSGKVLFVSRDQPLVAFHPHAMQAAQAARCAGDQGKFWEFRDLLITHHDRLSASNLAAYVRDARLEYQSFDSCMQEKKHQREIDQDLADAASLELRGTPTFVLGKNSGHAIDGVVIVGALPYETFERAIEQMLDSK